MVLAGLVIEAAERLVLAVVVGHAILEAPARVGRHRHELILRMLTAALLNSDGSIRLLTNGALSVTAPRLWQAADANAVKSPLSIACVGVNTVMSDGAVFSSVPW